MSRLFESRPLARRANEVKRYRVLTKVLPIVMACIAVFTSLLYAVSVMYTRYGSFTVSVNKYHQLQYGLSLSEHATFEKATSQLDCRAAESVTCIDGNTIDMTQIGVLDGKDNKKDYLCYTFYCKNAGQESVSYEYAINIVNMTMDIEKAVRIRLLTTTGDVHTQTDYARANSVDINTGESIPEPNTEPFHDKYTVVKKNIDNFDPGEITKFTVLIWLEGNDPDCIDDIIGGEFKIDMKFSVVKVNDTPV